jgi:hypothetical protein
MFCVPRSVTHEAFDQCSCEFFDLLRDSSNGECTITPGSLVLILCWLLIFVGAVLVSLWWGYVMYCAAKGKVLKFNLFSFTLIVIMLCANSQWLYALGRINMIVTTNNRLFDISRAFGSLMEGVSRSLAVISFAATARVMYTTLLNVLHLPCDEAQERSRTFAMTIIVCLFFIITLCVRFLTQHTPLGWIIGLFLVYCCWLIFRRAKRKMPEDIAFRLLRQSEQMAGDVIAQSVRVFLTNFFRTLNFATISLVTMAIGWYGQRLSGNKFIFQVFAAIGDIGMATAVLIAIFALTSLLTTLTQHRIQTWSNLQAIAILVSSSTPRALTAPPVISTRHNSTSISRTYNSVNSKSSATTEPEVLIVGDLQIVV